MTSAGDLDQIKALLLSYLDGLHHGDVVIMYGLTQALWYHQIPKTSRPVGPRINLTFRTIG